MLKVKAVHRFVLTVPRRRLELAAARRPSDSVCGLILRAAVARAGGEVKRGLTLLNRATTRATQAELPYVLDLLAPIYVALEDSVRLSEALERTAPTAGLEGPRTGLAAILAGMEGDFEKSRDLRRAALGEVESCEDRLTSARTLQRLAIAAHRIGDQEEALEFTLQAAQLCIQVKAYVLAAAAYSVAYNIHANVTGDITQAIEFTVKMEDCAKLAENDSYQFGAVAARYELCAEIADDRLLAECRERLRSHPLPPQYRERFPSGMADVLPFAWEGDFAAFRAGVILLHDAVARSRGQRALCLALQSLADAANHSIDQARRASRAALAVSTFRSLTNMPPHELRYLRIAHALASATCVLINDTARGRRMLGTKAAQEWPDCLCCLSVADGANWESAPARMRGYARAIARVRQSATPPSENVGLTPREIDVLRLLADGLTAPEIARETARSVHTVRAHTRSIIAKLGVRGRYAAISQARELGFLA